LNTDPDPQNEKVTEKYTKSYFFPFYIYEGKHFFVHQFHFFVKNQTKMKNKKEKNKFKKS